MNTAAGIDRHQLAHSLGWFSIGLGVMELVMPRQVSRSSGLNGDHSNLMRVLGLREIINGIGILSAPDPTQWLKARIAGDAIDLALLFEAMRSDHSDRGRLAMVTAAVAGITALDAYATRQFLTHGNGHFHGIHVIETITINKSPQELYQFWRNFEHLPKFMNHLESVQVLDDTHSRWKSKGPVGMQLEWDAEIINEHPNELIAWRSLPHADVDHAGTIRFEPCRNGRGTVVKVELVYSPPAGSLGAKLAQMLGDSPDKQIHVDLRRFKQLMETGEIARTEGQPAGRKRSTSLKYDDIVRA